MFTTDGSSRSARSAKLSGAGRAWAWWTYGATSGVVPTSARASAAATGRIIRRMDVSAFFEQGHAGDAPEPARYPARYMDQLDRGRKLWPPPLPVF